MLYVDEVGATEAEAIETALRKLRLSREDVVVRSVTETPEGTKVQVEATRSRGKEAVELLDVLLGVMSVEAELFYIESCDRITINMKGPNLGLVIGRNGSTLEALDTVLSAMHNHGFEMYKPIVINPGGYRDSRHKALKQLVKRAVSAADDTEQVSLPPMGQRDRKQVHEIIKGFPGFRSRSFGEGKERRVFIFRAIEEDEEIRGELEDPYFLPPTGQGPSEGRLESQP